MKRALITRMKMGRLTGLLVILLTAIPLHAQSRGDICASIGQTDVAMDICHAHLQLWEENRQRDLDAAARRTSDPQQFMLENADVLDRKIAQCQDVECIRIAYVEETQRLQTTERTAIEAATAEMALTRDDHESPDGRSPRAATSQAISVDEASTWQPSEPIASGAPTPGEASSSASITPHPPDQTDVETKASGSIAEAPDTETTRERGFLDQLMTLFLWSALGCVLLLMLLAATNHVVVFYDGLDVWWSFAPLLSLATGYIIARSISSEDAGISFLEILVMGVAILVAAASTFINYHNAIRHNRSMVLGLAIGTLKLLAASFTVLSVAGQLNRLSDSASTRRERAGATLILAVIGFAWWVLVNGQRVYEKRGWQPVPTT